MALISAPSLRSRFTQLVILALFILSALWFFTPSFADVRQLPVPSAPHQPSSAAPNATHLPPKPNHPISHLLARADADFAALLAKETHNVHDAAEAYRRRRGRQPPPHFDQWVAFAQNHSAVIVEDFFDRIYADLAPFWGVPASQVRDQARGFVHRISVRGGNVTKRTDIEGGRVWVDLWADLVASVAEWCPDVDLAVNVMDESRVVVPWEEVDGYMGKERESRRIVPTEELRPYYGRLGRLNSKDAKAEALFEPEFGSYGPYWPLAVVGCPPDSPARKAYIETDFSTPPPLNGSVYPKGSHEGYVQNWTLATSPCDNPDLQGLHGTFVEPISIANTKTFFPLFGGSKLPMNNEILLPAAMYWTDDPFYSGGQGHGGAWAEKKDQVIWRGAASGGRNKEENWTRFQRHRFVSMMNATSVGLAETGEQQAVNFAVPADGAYDLAALATPAEPATAPATAKAGKGGLGALADWIATWADAAFVHLLCFPDPSPPHCSYTDFYYSVHKALPMMKQYAYKYLPDIDGNSFSGRYRAFLFSTSLPIKATIYQEWHDSRLVAWKHFVPMDNTFSDVYGIMEYFVGNAGMGVGGHDAEAERIAREGREWAERVLRREDMRVYVLRLLMEYARVGDGEREIMGWREEG
ncbi:hypothetical protein LTR08_005093 [Meristemomyces frigidus]|nr:hypothetical protein LTR08_005093 [Meristemomyces frigidus]